MSQSRRYEEDRIDFLFKLVIVGDSGVGKTSLLLKYVDDVFSETFISTIGVDFKIKTFDMDGKRVKLQIWDTAGQDRFRNIVSTFYRNAHGILVMYDVTDMTSLQSVSQWLKEIDRYAGGNARGVLVGNKCDLHGKREVTEEEGRQLAERNDLLHLETSAKTAHNVHALFSQLTHDLMATCQPLSRDGTLDNGRRALPLPASHQVDTSSGGVCGC